MPYYMGDYYSRTYRGDYYRGDPGFLSFLGGAMKTIGGFVPGIGPLITGAGEAISKKAASSAVKALPAAAGVAATSMMKSAGTAIKTTVLKHPVLTGAGAAGVIGAAAGVAGTKLLSRHAAGRKRRRMRPTNVRALRRALRRAAAFEKIAMRTIHLVHPKKHVRFGGWKRRSKKRSV